MTETHQKADQWIILPGTTVGGEVETFSVDFLIRNRDTAQAKEFTGVVDTGALFTVIPVHILDELSIERERTRTFSFADGSRRELAMGWVEMELQGERDAVQVIIARTAVKS